MGSMSKSRAWAIVTILLVACIVAVAIGLGIGLQPKNDDDDDDNTMMDCPVPVAPPSSSRLTKDSPIYVKPTDNNEGFYRFATVSTDAPICSYYGTSEKKGYAIMAREMAPGAATGDMFTNGTSSREGGMSIGIPGEVKGLYEAWKLGGKLPWASLFKSSIQMCTEGFRVGKLLGTDIENNKEIIKRYGELKKMLTNEVTGELLKENDLLKLPKLGATLQKIADDPYTFYNGSLADDIANDIADVAGIITVDDLKMYTAAVKDPLKLTLTNGDNTVLSPPPPSSGAVILLILNILDGFNMNADSVSTGEKAVEAYHRITEAFKHGFSVRTNLGDADQEDQKFKDTITELLQNMTSSSWGAMKRDKITRDTHDTAYYEPTYTFIIPDAGTTHVSVLGPEGDAVSITSTVNLYFGSKVVGSRTGIVFNDEMDDFSTPNTTNYFGVPASPANFIKPYKRPLSSMSPTIVIDKDGDVKLVTGATGGTRIITSTALSIIQTLMLKFGLKESTEFPRIHHQLLPPTLRIEEAMPKVILDGLRERGHEFDMKVKLGSSVQAVLTRNKQENTVQNIHDKKHTEIFSYSDPVRDGVADGV